MNQIDTLLDNVEILPAAPSLLAKLLPKLSDVDANYDEIVETIMLDPGLTAKLLQVCNSAFFGQPEPIATVPDAVNRVGYQSVYLLVSMISGADAFPAQPPGGLDVGRLWAHSVTTAFSTKYIAESLNQDTNVLFTAGLLHDVGKIVLAQIRPGVFNDQFYKLTEDRQMLREKEIFGCNHAEVGRALMDRWRLPAQLIDAVGAHHEPVSRSGVEPVAACLELGNMFSHGQVDRRVLASPQFMDRLNALDVEPQAMPQWFKKLQSNQQLIDGMSRLKASGKPSLN